MEETGPVERASTLRVGNHAILEDEEEGECEDEDVEGEGEEPLVSSVAPGKEKKKKKKKMKEIHPVLNPINVTVDGGVGR